MVGSNFARISTAWLGDSPDTVKPGLPSNIASLKLGSLESQPDWTEVLYLKCQVLKTEQTFKENVWD